MPGRKVLHLKTVSWFDIGTNFGDEIYLKDPHLYDYNVYAYYRSEDGYFSDPPSLNGVKRFITVNGTQVFEKKIPGS